jgi:hypothetical protein
MYIELRNINRILRSAYHQLGGALGSTNPEMIVIVRETLFY